MVRLLTTLRTGETHFAHFFCLLSRSFIFFVDRAEEFDRQLVHAVESVMIEWTHQVRDVLKKDSSQPLLDGENPTPFVDLTLTGTNFTVFDYLLIGCTGSKFINLNYFTLIF